METPSEYGGARRPSEDVTDRRLSLFATYVDLCDQIEQETAQLRDLEERLGGLHARREEFRNELLNFLGGNLNVPPKGLPF